MDRERKDKDGKSFRHRALTRRISELSRAIHIFVLHRPIVHIGCAQYLNICICRSAGLLMGPGKIFPIIGKPSYSPPAALHDLSAVSMV